MRYVRYNGGKDSFYGCSNPASLQKGKIYKVIRVDVYRSYTDYIIEGLLGKYNSVWFDDLPSYLAFGKEVPKVGNTLDVIRQEFENGKLCFKHYYTTKVTAVEELSYNTYLAVTYNTVYIVQVLTR